jgi:aryl-alcohol dehydrogenase-like predicted oxidoreductase
MADLADTQLGQRKQDKLILPTRVGLGTVQMGKDYGVTNHAGRPSLEEAAQIVRVAAEHGVRIVDTAAVYGKSERVLGQILQGSHEFRIVTKIPPLRERAITSRQIDLVKSAFERSLNRLGVSRVYGLLVHHPDDLLADGGDWLWEVLCDLQESGQVEKIGVSVYGDAQLEPILDEFDIDLVQLPLNVLDQRALMSGRVDSLREAGIEVHARSAFLQGILLAKPSELPDQFAPLRPHLERYHRFRVRHNLTAIKAALSFVLQTSVDCVVIGAVRADEFAAVLNAAVSLPEQPVDFSEFACHDERFINPTHWAA